MLSGLVVLPLAVFLPAAPQAPARPPLDKAAEKWVQDTLKKMTLDEKVGQLLAPSIDAMVTSTDSEVYEKKLHLVRDLKVGAIHVFGGSEPMPAALLNPNYPSGGSAGRKGDPLAAATFLNRLQQASAIPLLTTADFEGGRGVHPERRARGCRARWRSRRRATRSWPTRPASVSATEARAIGVTVDFYPVVDVNNNPRNPIINIRSFGEDVGLVSEMGDRLHARHPGGRRAGDGEALPGPRRHRASTRTSASRRSTTRASTSTRWSCRRSARRSTRASTRSCPRTSSCRRSTRRPASRPRSAGRSSPGLLRGEMKFDGLIFTDSMSMDAISKNFGDDRAAVMAVKAGVDFVLHSPDDDAAFKAIKAAVESGEIDRAQVDRSVERILRVKARLGLHKSRVVDVNAVETKIGGRAHEAVNAEICERAHHADQGRPEPGAAQGRQGREHPLPVRASTTRAGGARACRAGRSSPR